MIIYVYFWLNRFNKVASDSYFVLSVCVQVPVWSVPGVQRHIGFAQHVWPCLDSLCGTLLKAHALLSRYYQALSVSPNNLSSITFHPPLSSFFVFTPQLLFPSRSLNISWYEKEFVLLSQTPTAFSPPSLPGLPVAAPREMLGVSRRPGDSCDLSVSPHHDNSCDAGPPAALQLPHRPHWLCPQRLWSLCEWSQFKDKSPRLMNVVHALYSRIFWSSINSKHKRHCLNPS